MKRKQTSHRRAATSVPQTSASPTRRRSSRIEDPSKSILQATTDCYGLWNLSSGPMSLSEVCLSVLGYSAAAPPIRNGLPQNLVHPDDRAAFDAQLKAHLAGKAPVLACEFRLRTKTGVYKWFEIRGQAIRRHRRTASIEIAYAVCDIHARKEQQERVLAGQEQIDVTNRKHMETGLRRSEEKLAKAFRDAPLALTLTSARNDRYIEVNDAFTEATGYNREELIGKTPLAVGFCVEPEKRAELMRRVLSTREVRNIDILYRTKSGEIREAVESAVLVDIENEPSVLSVIQDSTEHKQALEALKESEERLRIAIDTGHMYTVEWDIATDVVQRSEHAKGILNLTNHGAKHTRQEFLERLQPDDRQDYLRLLKSLTPENSDYKTVFRLMHEEGRTTWLEESGRGIFGPEGILRKVIGIVVDVTELRQSERALRELSRRLITSQEEERRRIARELHDHIGQEAALICVQAQRVDSGVADEEHTTRSDVHELYRRIKVLSGDISKLSHRLHSSELSFLGLAVAAERLCRDFANQYGIDVDYQAKSLPQSLDSSKSLCFYRVLQEALQNVAKHSHASQVIVELQGVQNELTLKVRDNGSGFDVEKTGLEAGLGLLSMRERLTLVGGRFAIASKPGSGTKLTANVMF